MKSAFDHQPGSIKTSVIQVLLIAVGLSVALLAKSVLDFSHSGPPIREEVLNHYSGYIVYALARLTLWSIALTALMAAAGALVYDSLRTLFNWRFRPVWSLFASMTGVGLITAVQFCNHLLYIPSGIVTSLNYSPARLYPLWRLLTPERVQLAEWSIAAVFLVPLTVCCLYLYRKGGFRRATTTLLIMCAYTALVLWAIRAPEPEPLAVTGYSQVKPNIVMIGSDSLRADRLGVNGYARKLTPHIDALAGKGVNFSRAFVPLARTGPSIASLMTGTWPHTHGVRANFAADAQKRLPVPGLPRLLSEAGYRTAAIGDWAASDLGKFDFGFQAIDTADDQWNIKFLLRQGPKDLRLFLSLFTHNRAGKYFLPEIYYLAGTPLTREIGRDARTLIGKLAKNDAPFFLNLFMASTHGPFGSAYPYYSRFTAPEYNGKSRFSIYGLTTPEEVVTRQEQDKRQFDIQQINNLYDGAVQGFDDEVGRILDYLDASGLGQNTIVVIYSDHGVDLFEGDTWGQGNVLSEYSHRVPLVMHDPRKTGGRRVDQTVSTVDVAPTLLDLAGIMPAPSMEGRSLVSFMTGAGNEPARSVYAETGIWIANVRGLPSNRIQYPRIFDLLEIKNKDTGTMSIKDEYLDRVITAKARMIRKGKWQLVYFPFENGAGYSLYDMDSDPALQHALAGDNLAVTGSLKAGLDAWMSMDGRRVRCHDQLIRPPCPSSDHDPAAEPESTAR